jgi:hypothetical protein
VMDNYWRFVVSMALLGIWFQLIIIGDKLR